MGPNGKLYRPEYAKELLEIAKGDYESAYGYKINMGRPENICYSAAMCRKIIDSTLSFRKMIIHTHDLDSLVSFTF